MSDSDVGYVAFYDTSLQYKMDSIIYNNQEKTFLPRKHGYLVAHALDKKRNWVEEKKD